MTTYSAPLNDINFLLNDLLGVDKISNLPVFADVSSDLNQAILEEAAKLAENSFLPLNQSGDEEGCTLNDEGVKTPSGFKEAYTQYCEGGWLGITGDTEYGGQGLPSLFNLILSEFFGSANWSLSMYPGLTRPAAETILTWGSDEQKALFLPNMYSGVWSGTMNLTEPHCGSDLGLLKTKAVLQEDGTYKISGTKIFISAGDQDLSENIIHLVLARIEGAPAGVSGISLFIVPKYQLKDGETSNERNNVECSSIEKKMGIHGSATCVMNYDQATGFLLGAENAGMRAMFTMMNEARLGCGVQGIALAEVAQQNAINYSMERLQGRSLSPDADQKPGPVPIIHHPDIRRMLMTNRIFIEGARAATLWAGLKVDVARQDPNERDREIANELLAFLTPVVKSYFTDQGIEAIRRAMQCYGGYGFINETGVEQTLRDACIAPLYEGTNGIQALDLVARKLVPNNGETADLLASVFRDGANKYQSVSELEDILLIFERALEDFEKASKYIVSASKNNPDNLGACGHYYLNLCGLIILGFFWIEMAGIAKNKLSKNEGYDVFLNNKVKTAKFFFEQVFPEYRSFADKIKSPAETSMAIEPEHF